MEISISVPDDVADRLHAKWNDLPRHVLEALVADAYRQGVLTAAEVRRILGLVSRYETDAFLKQAGADLDYTWQDLEEDLETFRQAYGCPRTRGDRRPSVGGGRAQPRQRRRQPGEAAALRRRQPSELAGGGRFQRARGQPPRQTGALTPAPWQSSCSASTRRSSRVRSSQQKRPAGRWPLSRMTIDEQVREAAREVAEAFGVPLTRVEAVVERIEREALARTFGDDPRVPIADELARELRSEVAVGLETLLGCRADASPVIDFPQELRRSQA